MLSRGGVLGGDPAEAPELPQKYASICEKGVLSSPDRCVITLREAPKKKKKGA